MIDDGIKKLGWALYGLLEWLMCLSISLEIEEYWSLKKGEAFLIVYITWKIMMAFIAVGCFNFIIPKKLRETLMKFGTCVIAFLCYHSVYLVILLLFLWIFSQISGVNCYIGVYLIILGTCFTVFIRTDYSKKDP